MSGITLVVRFTTLECIKPEDNGSDGDEIVLKLHGTNGQVDVLLKKSKVTAGKKLPIKAVGYSWGQIEKVVLFDEDAGWFADPDDKLGTVKKFKTTLTAPGKPHTAKFTKDDAEYVLSYEVS